MLSEKRIAEIVDEHCDLKSQIVRMVHVRLSIKQALAEDCKLICDYLDDHRDSIDYAIHVVREGGPNA